MTIKEMTATFGKLENQTLTLQPADEYSLSFSFAVLMEEISITRILVQAVSSVLYSTSVI